MKQIPTTTLLEPEDDLEIGPLEILPSALTICFENNSEVKHPEWYGKETTVKVGEIAFTKNAP